MAVMAPTTQISLRCATIEALARIPGELMMNAGIPGASQRRENCCSVGESAQRDGSQDRSDACAGRKGSEGD